MLLLSLKLNALDSLQDRKFQIYVVSSKLCSRCLSAYPLLYFYLNLQPLFISAANRGKWSATSQGLLSVTVLPSTWFTGECTPISAACQTWVEVCTLHSRSLCSIMKTIVVNGADPLLRLKKKVKIMTLWKTLLHHLNFL